MSLTMLDLNSPTSQTYTAEPASPLPRIWVGFVVAFGFLVAEVVEVMQGNDTAIGPYTLAASIAGWAYWLFCIHRFHRILHQISLRIGGESIYPITPRQAVGYHFIPFFNLYWLFKWTGELATFLKTNTSLKVASGTGLGIILFLSVLTMRLVDGFVGLSLMFGLALYLKRKLRRAVTEHEATRGVVEVFA
ncbi:MAG TPA: hypothetical protein VE685_24105 [Thermoanaerobaculia bacterium]|nr:hypothetical protein [Thermoanaerobaculia bacterium]